MSFFRVLLEVLLSRYMSKVASVETSSPPPAAYPPPAYAKEIVEPLVERVVSRALDERERLTYEPPPPERRVLGETIEYETWSEGLIEPGLGVTLCLGVRKVVEAGWPGFVPEMTLWNYGVAEPFQMHALRVARGFVVEGLFCGAQNAFPIAPGSGGGVLSQLFEPGYPQPKYPRTPECVSITVLLRNASNRRRAAWVRAIGERVPESPAPPRAHEDDVEVTS